MEFANTSFESTANYTCDLGYNLNGNSTRTCEASGEWYGDPPSCERKWLKYFPSTSTFPGFHLVGGRQEGAFTHSLKASCPFTPLPPKLESFFITTNLQTICHQMCTTYVVNPVISPVHVNFKQQFFYFLGFIHINHLKIIVRQSVRQLYCVIFTKFYKLSSPI